MMNYKRKYDYMVKHSSCSYISNMERYNSDLLSKEAKKVYDAIKNSNWEIDMYIDFCEFHGPLVYSGSGHGFMVETEHPNRGIFHVYIMGTNYQGYYVVGAGEAKYDPNTALINAYNNMSDYTKSGNYKSRHPKIEL